MESKADYELKDLKLEVAFDDFAKQFISRYHYSKTCSNIVVAIGEFIGTDMKNCIVFNYCAGREMAKQVMQGGDNSNTLELARMVSLEPKPKNLESYCISKALRWIKENMPNIKVIISYADNSVGHHGYCYQASGFTYYGQSRPTKEHYLDGKRIHERVLNSRFGTSSQQELEHLLGDRYACKLNEQTKSRYYKIIAQNKKERKEIEKKILVKGLPYPKGDNARYDMNVKGSFAELDSDKANEVDDRKISQQLSLFDFDFS